MGAQLEMKRKEIAELAGLMGFDEVKKEVETDKSLETWAKRSSHFFTKSMKRMLFGETDNMIWNDGGSKITQW